MATVGREKDIRITEGEILMQRNSVCWRKDLQCTI